MTERTGKRIEVRSIKRNVLDESTRYWSVGYHTDPVNKTDDNWVDLLDCETFTIAVERAKELQREPCYAIEGTDYL